MTKKHVKVTYTVHNTHPKTACTSLILIVIVVTFCNKEMKVICDFYEHVFSFQEF